MINDGDYKALSVLYTALIAGILFFCCAAIAVHFTAGVFVNNVNLANWFFGISVLAAAVVIMFQRAAYRSKVDALQQESITDKERLIKLRSILIAYAAICEFFAIAGVILFILFGTWSFFLLTAMCLVEMGRKFPSRSKIESIINVF